MPYTGGGSKLALSTVTAVRATIEPVANEKVQSIGGVFGKTYRLFIDSSIDIQEMDQIKDENGVIYTVRKGGVSQWQHGFIDFKEIIITQS